MDRENRLARLFRALTDKTQQDLAKDLGIEKGTLTNCESGKLKPSSSLLNRMAEAAGITVDQGDELLQLHDTLSRTRQRVGRDPEALFAELGEPLRTRADRAFQRLLTLRLPDTPPRAEDRIPAKELFANLEELTPDQRLAVVGIATEYQTWAVCELAVEKSLAGDGEPEDWAELAVEISEYVGGTKEWQNRVRGYALAAKARAFLRAGKVREGEGVSKEAWRLWGAGVDGAGMLDGGRVGLGLCRQGE